MTQKTYLQNRTAKDPEAYVAKVDQTYARAGMAISARIVSIGGKTPSGMFRYVVEFTVGEGF